MNIITFIVGFAYKPYWRGSSSIGINKTAYKLGRVSGHANLFSLESILFAWTKNSKLFIFPILLHLNWTKKSRGIFPIILFSCDIHS